MSNKLHSNFWLPENIFNKKMDHIQLASHRQAISNFVSIMTRKRMPVTFKVDGGSYTDGKQIVVSGDINRDNYDSIIGTSLHEASHILFTDFMLLKNLMSEIPQSLINSANQKGIEGQVLHYYLKDFWNWVEDRYIDKMTFMMAPGYRGYYRALYSKVWHSDVVTEILKSDEFRDETLESYRARLINLTNPNSDLSALNGLQSIWDIVDLKTIDRLSDPYDRMALAWKIGEIVLENVGSQPKSKKKKTKDDYRTIPGTDPNKSDDNFPSKFTDEDDNESESEKKDESESNDFLDDIFGGVANELPKDIGVDAEKSSSSKNENSLSKRKINKFKKHIEKQSKFLDPFNHDSKKSISEEDNQKISVVIDSKVELKPVGFDKSTVSKYANIEHGIPQKIDCVVIRKVTVETLNSGIIPMTTSDYNGSRREFTGSKEAVIKGLTMGTVLGKKLKVRGESRSTKYTRQNSGRIDKRLISELGFGQKSVFSHIHIDSYKDAFIHISIDASSSMNSEGKFERCITASTAIAKAASMIQNLEVVISFRTVTNSQPCIVIAYDSREDSINKIKTIFPCFATSGTTPEGLCFEAILDDIPRSGQKLDSYFLNFSDGMPYFLANKFGYQGQSACEHTRKQVKIMIANGVSVLSYFIDGGGSYGSDFDQFQTMYGRNSVTIDVTNILNIANTMNRKFLEKSS